MQRQVPAVLGLEVPHIQFVDSGWTFLLCLQRRLLTVQTVQMTVEILQLPFLDWLLTARYCAMPLALFTVVTVVDIPVVTQSCPLVLTVQKTLVILLTLTLIWWSTSLLGRSNRFHACCL